MLLVVLCYGLRGFLMMLGKFFLIDVYAELVFKVPVGRFGDCYDRYLLRL